MLKPTKIRAGYLAVDLSNANGRKMKKVHQAVLEAFVGPCPFGEQVNHKNGVVTDNRLANLEYCTPSENTFHSYRVLGRKHPQPPKGELQHCSKLTSDLVVKFRTMHTSGVGIREITRLSGLNRRSIQMMLRRKSWKHIF